VSLSSTKSGNNSLKFLFLQLNSNDDMANVRFVKSFVDILPANDDDDDVYLCKLQTRLIKNLYHIFPYKQERHTKKIQKYQ
jgi:hypothetical protein